MKREEYRPLAQNHRDGFFKLTLLKAILFSMAFVAFVYFMTPQSLFRNSLDRILNSILWLVSLMIIYFTSCLLVWILKKVKR